MTTQEPIPQRLELVSWRFRPAKLGCLTENAGPIEFKPLTIVCGQNNTGKTWGLYALYAFLSGLRINRLLGIETLVKELAEEGQAVWDLEKWFSEHGRQLLRKR